MNNIPLDTFKDRELEILQLIAEGLSNQDIADQLFITKETVRWYNKQIYSKLGTSRRTEAIALARELGLIYKSQHSAFNNLPITHGTFWGRQEELTQLDHLVKQTNSRLISLVAPGGMGKTRLAIELSHQIADRFKDGVYFIDLAPVGDARNVIPLMIELFNLALSPRNPLRPILDFCRDKHLLLLFDNFENVLDARDYLLEILKTAPQVKIIVTSRERLDHPDETVFQINSLQRDAEQLFIEAAQRRVPKFTVAESEKLFIQQICKLVDGMPLAIILAAAWVDVLSVQEIAEEVKQNLDFLEDELGTLPFRQRSVRAVLEQTWRRLTAAEQQRFMRLAVFRGGFDRRAAQKITDTNIYILQALIGKALIQRKATGRFDLHPIIREFAYSKLLELELDHPTFYAHAHFYHALGKTYADQLDGEHHIQAHQAIVTEFDNMTAAIDFAYEHSDLVLLQNLLIDLRTCHNATNQYALYVRQVRRALPHISDVTDKVLLLSHLAERLPYAGLFTEVESTCEEALALLDTISNPDLTLIREKGHLLYVTSSILLERNELEQAKQVTLKVQKLFEACTYDEGLSKVALRLGIIALRSGDFALAEQYLLKSLELANKIGANKSIARSKSTLGTMYDHLKQLDKAETFHRAYLDYVRHVNDIPEIGIALNNLGRNAEMRGDYARAYHYYQEALTLIQRQGYQATISALEINMGFVALQYHRLDDAHRNFVKGIQLAHKIDWLAFVLEALVGLAIVAYQQSEYAYSAMLVAFIENHEGRNPDVEDRLRDASFDFQAVLSAEEWQLAQRESEHMNLDKLVEQLAFEHVD